MTTSEQHSFISVLCIHQDGYYVAQMLEHDLVARGKDRREAIANLARVLMARYKLAAKHGVPTDPLADVPPAPREYWDAFERTKRKRVYADPILAAENAIPPAYMVQAVVEKQALSR